MNGVSFDIMIFADAIRCILTKIRYIQTAQVYSVTARVFGQDLSRCFADSKGYSFNGGAPREASEAPL